MPRHTHLIAVGACAIDTILTVPHFPAQDSKLRATALTKRRGGNCPNTLEVLKQLVQHECARLDAQNAATPASTTNHAIPMPKLSLIATFPSKNCASTEFMKSSFNLKPISMTVGSVNGDQKLTVTQDPVLDFSHCVYREEYTEPISSYIISDASTSSRTIINYNALPEMTVAECVERFDAILSLYGDNTQSHDVADAERALWFHFEGRIPDVTLEGMRYLRRTFQRKANRSLTISVEIEKPGREGLQELVGEADVVFYSRGWAEHEGYQSAEDCVRQQAWKPNKVEPSFTDDDQESSRNSDGLQSQSRQRTFICTWGASGACAITEGSSDVVLSPAYQHPTKEIIDTTGAGDTFIAGILFTFLHRHETSNSLVAGAPTISSTNSKSEDLNWSLRSKLDFANELAGRKILQNGFANLGNDMMDTVSKLD